MLGIKSIHDKQFFPVLQQLPRLVIVYHLLAHVFFACKNYDLVGDHAHKNAFVFEVVVETTEDVWDIYIRRRRPWISMMKYGSSLFLLNNSMSRSRSFAKNASSVVRHVFGRCADPLVGHLD